MDRHQPETSNPQISARFGVSVVQVIQFLNQTWKISDTIIVAVIEAAHENLIEDRIIPPGLSIRSGWKSIERSYGHRNRCGQAA